MLEFKTENTHEAIEILKRNSVISSSAIDTLEVTINNQMKDYFPAYGKMLSFSFIKEKKVSNNISIRYYILNFSEMYLKFSFVLYNNGSGWKITSFNYNTELNDLL